MIDDDDREKGALEMRFKGENAGRNGSPEYGDVGLKGDGK